MHIGWVDNVWDSDTEMHIGWVDNVWDSDTEMHIGWVDNVWDSVDNEWDSVDNVWDSVDNVWDSVDEAVFHISCPISEDALHAGWRNRIEWLDQGRSMKCEEDSGRYCETIKWLSNSLQ
jgi:hypothetical protein